MDPARNLETQSVADTRAGWPVWKRLAFRFVFLYWVLYCLPTQGAASLLDLLPWGTEKLSTWMGWPLARLSHEVGLRIFHLTGEGADWHSTGSGDTAMNYMMTFCVLVLSLLGAAVWSAIDERRGRREYQTAYAWLRLGLRFTLAVTMFEYGFAKIFPGQFGLSPSLRELSETYGESSPMHVLWFFMTVSRPYTIFGGLMEAIPGALLLFRRTSTLGLLGTAAVMANVVALNFCYDVPVKLYSTHLLLMVIFLLLPDFKAMWKFFVRRQEAALTGVWVRRPERKALRIGAHMLQAVVVLACAWAIIGGTYTQREMPRIPSPVRGVWNVDALEGWPGDDQPKTLILDNNSFVTAIGIDGKRKNFPVKYDAAKNEIQFTKIEKPTLLHWSSSPVGQLQMSGSWMAAPVGLTLHRVNPDVYPLQSRGFHWVNEKAFNQ